MAECFISCNLHDYIEIACLYGYQVKVVLKDSQTLEGKTIDTMTTAEKREFLILDNGQKQQIELHQIKKLQVLTPNAQFTEIAF